MYHSDTLEIGRGPDRLWAAAAAIQIVPRDAAHTARSGLVCGSSPAMERVREMIQRVAPTDATVLIVGESGSGKELVANSIHQASTRRGPFVAVNCGAIPASLVEAELFGYEKGAFTGAGRTHHGYFERAAGGTLFLDEITEMSPDAQVRLLRVLETGRFWRVGGDTEIRAQVRVVAATNRDPAAAVAEGRLREDLMYRLAVFPISLPPLRGRGADVELLARHFLELLNEEAGTSKRLSARSLGLLRSHPWPGNVRELKNCVHRAYILADDEVELEHMFPGALAEEDEPGRLSFAIGTSLAAMEKRTILATLAHCQGNKRRAAELLGVSLKTLYNRLNEYAAEAAAQALPGTAMSSSVSMN
jgi:DNA-binding NtrC family response regulator